MPYPPASLAARTDASPGTPDAHSQDHTDERTAINDIVTEIGPSLEDRITDLGATWPNVAARAAGAWVVPIAPHPWIWLVGATDPLPAAGDGLAATDLVVRSSAHPFSQHGSLTRMEPTDVMTTGLSSVAAVSGELLITYMTAPSSYAVTKLRYMTGAAQTGAITMNKLGLYTIAANGDLTLAGRTANDTTVVGANITASPRSLDTTGGYPASYDVTFGTRYAIGIVLVGAGLGGLRGTFGPTGLLPKTRAVLTGQTDLPTSIVAASLTTERTGTPWLAAEA